MSKSEVLSGFGIDIGACGVEPQRGRQRGFRESFLASVSCSTDPNPTGNSKAPSAPQANDAFMTALHNTIASRGDYDIEGNQATPNPQPRSGRTMERHQKAKRSHSFQPRVGVVETEQAQDTFVLPQYIGSQYDATKSSKPSKKQSKETDNDTDDSSNKTCHHIECMPHGAYLTFFGILLSWAGLALALFSRQSLNFVSLDRPWHVSSTYEDIASLGVMHAEICYNETVSTLKDASKVGCFQVALATNEDLNDPIFKLTAVFVSLSVLMGSILTISMTTTVIWKTINFRALGTGYLFVYCFQSLAFLFFDTDICENHDCKIDVGCMYCIAASVCWITTCLLCAKMESNRVRAELKRERKRRKTAAAKEATRRSSAVRRTGGGTVVTERTTSTISDELTTLGFDRDEELAIQPIALESQNKKHAKARSLSRSRGRDSIRAQSPKAQSPRMHSRESFSSSRGRGSIRTRSPRTYSPRRQSMRSLSSSRGRDSIRARSPRPQSPRRFSMEENARKFDTSSSFQSSLHQSTSGIARQHESIITLGPNGRHSSAGSCHTPKSVSSLTSLDDTLDNRYHGRGVEYQGKAMVSNRGRSRSKSRSRARSGSRSRAEQQQIHRSKSRGRSSRAKSKSDRQRADSKTRHQDSGSMKPPRARRIDIEHQAKVASMSQSERKRHVRTATAPADFSDYLNTPISPLSNQSPSEIADVPFVTSYFDI